MDVDEFWGIVERARAAAGPEADRARRERRPSVVVAALVDELSRCSLPQIIAFDQVLREVSHRADSWDTCAACWIIEYGFLSDDGFADFQAGLVRLGRSTFESVVADPDSLAEHPAVLEISRSAGRDLWIGDETLLYAASRAYERLTGNPDGYCEAADAPEPAAPPRGPSPTGERWDLRNGDEWRRRLPRLAELFGARMGS